MKNCIQSFSSARIIQNNIYHKILIFFVLSCFLYQSSLSAQSNCLNAEVLSCGPIDITDQITGNLDGEDNTITEYLDCGVGPLSGNGGFNGGADKIYVFNDIGTSGAFNSLIVTLTNIPSGTDLDLYGINSSCSNSCFSNDLNSFSNLSGSNDEIITLEWTDEATIIIVVEAFGIGSSGTDFTLDYELNGSANINCPATTGPFLPYDLQLSCDDGFNSLSLSLFDPQCILLFPTDCPTSVDFYQTSSFPTFTAEGPFAAAEQIYTFTPSQQGTVDITLTGNVTGFLRRLPGFLVVSTNEYPSSANSYNFIHTPSTDLGFLSDTYVLTIDSDTQGAPYTLDFDFPGCNNSICDIATEITCGETISDDTFNSDNNVSNPDYENCFGFSESYNGGDKVYSFVRSSFNEVNYITLDQYTSSVGDKLDVFVFSDCLLEPSDSPCLTTTYQNQNPSYLFPDIKVIKLEQLDPGTYYIVVDGITNTTSGSYNLTVSCEGLDCTQADPILCGEPTEGEINNNFDSNNNSGYTQNCISTGVNAKGMFTSGEDYYSFTIPEDGDYIVSLDILGGNDLELFVFNEDFCCNTVSSPTDVGIFVYTEPECDAQCQTGSTGIPGQDESAIIENAIAGQTYIIVVDGFLLAEDNYILEVICNNLDCTNATPAQCGQYYSFSEGLENKTFEYSQGGQDFLNYNGNEQIFSLTPDFNQEYTFSLGSSAIASGTELFITRGCNPENVIATTVGSVDGIINYTLLEGGVTYYLVFDATDFVGGSFGIDCKPECLPKSTLECNSSISATNDPNIVGFIENSYSYYFIGFDDFVNLEGPEVYYTFIPPTNDNYTFSLSGIIQGGDMDIFILTDCQDPYSCIATTDGASANDPDIVTVSLNANVEYSIVVDGDFGTISDFIISVEGCEDGGYCELVVPYEADVTDESPFVQFITDMLPGTVDSFVVNYPLDTIGIGGYEITETVVNNPLTAVEYTCPLPGCYSICFWYVDNSGLLQSCCIKYCAQYPTDDCFNLPQLTVVDDLPNQFAEEVSFTCGYLTNLTQVLITEPDSTIVQIQGATIDTFINESELIILPYGQYEVCCWSYDAECDYWSICCETYCLPYIQPMEECTQSFFASIGQGLYKSNTIATNVNFPPIVTPSTGVSVNLLASSTETFWEIDIEQIGNYKVEVDIDGDGVYDCQQYLCYYGDDDEQCFDLEYKDSQTIQLTCPDNNLLYWSWYVNCSDDPNVDCDSGILEGNGICWDVPYTDAETTYEICKYYQGCCAKEEVCCETICYSPFVPSYAITSQGEEFFLGCDNIDIVALDVNNNGDFSGQFQYTGIGLGQEGSQWTIHAEPLVPTSPVTYEVLASGSGNAMFNTANADNGFFTFIPGRDYFICYSYINDDGCREYCCIKISVPTTCFSQTTSYAGSNGSLEYEYSFVNTSSSNEEVFHWFSSGGAVDNPSNDTTTITYSFSDTYYVCCLIYDPNTRCYNLCCTLYCITDPFECGSDIVQQFNTDGTINLDPLNTYGFEAIWMIDLPIQYAATIPQGQQYTFNPVDYGIPNSTLITVSVSYVDLFGCTKICCKEICIDPDEDCSPECYTDCCDGVDNSWIIDVVNNDTSFCDNDSDPNTSGVVMQSTGIESCTYYFVPDHPAGTVVEVVIYSCSGVIIDTINLDFMDIIPNGQIMWDCNNGFYESCVELCPNGTEVFCEYFSVLPQGGVSQVLPNWEQIGMADHETTNAFTTSFLTLVPFGHSRYNIPFDNIDKVCFGLQHNSDIPLGALFELRDNSNNVVLLDFNSFQSILPPDLYVSYNDNFIDGSGYIYTQGDVDNVEIYWSGDVLEVKYAGQVLFSSDNIPNIGGLASIDIISKSGADPNSMYVSNLCLKACEGCDEFVFTTEDFQQCDDVNIENVVNVSEDNATVQVAYTGQESGLGYDIYEITDTGDAVLLAEETSGSWTCGVDRDYLFCYKYLDENGCIQYCCIKVRIPITCSDVTTSYQGTDGSLDYTYTYQGSEEVMDWYINDIAVGGNNTSEIVNYPTSGSYTVCCLIYDDISQCYSLCCKEVCVEDPLECGDAIVVVQDLDGTFNLSLPGDNMIFSWQIDIPESLAGTMIDPDNFDPSAFGIAPGTKITVSVSYKDADGCLKLCCKMFCSSDPVDCGDCEDDFDYNASSFVSCDDLTIVGVNNVTDQVSDISVNYSGISTDGSISIYELNGDIETFITSFTGIDATYNCINGKTYLFCYSYVDTDGCTQYCCIKVSIPLTCGLITPQYEGSTGTLAFSYSYEMTTFDILGWYPTDGLLDAGGQSDVITYEIAGSYYICCLLWDDMSQCYILCCKEQCVEDPVECETVIIDDFDVAMGTYNLTIDQPNAILIEWQIDTPAAYAGVIEDPSNFNPIDLGISEGSLLTISVSYIDDSGCLKLCCKTICASGPDNCDPCIANPPDCDLFTVTPGDFAGDWLFDFDDDNSLIAVGTIITNPDGSIITQSGQSNTYMGQLDGTYTFCRDYEDECANSYQCCNMVCVTPELSCSDVTVNVDGLEATFIHNIANGTAYSWNFGDGAILLDSDMSIVHTYPNITANYLASLTVFDYCGDSCVVSVEVDIESGINILEVIAETTSPSCVDIQDGSISLTISGGLPPYSIDWSGTGPDGDLEWNNLAAGIYNVTVIDANNGEVSLEIDVDQAIAASLDIGLTQPTCGESNGMFSINITNEVTINSYSFSQNGLVLSNDISQDIDALSPGLYSVMIDYGLGCSLDSTVILDASTIPDVFVDAINSSCGVADGAISFTTSDGTMIIEIENTDTGEIINSNEVTQLASSDYIFIVTDANGCTQLVFESIETTPDFEFSLGDDATVCANENMQLVTGVDTADYTIEWYLDGLQIMGADSSSFLPTEPGSYTALVTNDFGCTAADTVLLNYYPQLIEVIGQGGQFVIGEPVTFEVLGAETIFWSSSTLELSCTNCENQEVFTLGNGVLELVATDINGCNLEQTYNIAIDSELIFPNYLTPNGDNMNDLLQIRGSEQFAMSSLTVFNKWGQIVYQSDSYANNWSGVDNSGNQLPDGAYYYALEYSIGELTLTKTSDLTILRND